jgi:hypothetical protein
MGISDEAFEKFLLEKFYHAKSKEKEKTKGFFAYEPRSCRFMDVFIKKISLFILTLVSCIILSMFNWLIDCKFLQRIFKSYKSRVKIFKFLNI